MSPNMTGFPATLTVPGVICADIDDIDAENWFVVGVPVTLFNSVLPLNTLIVVPLPLVVTTPAAVVGRVTDSLDMLIV